MNSPHCCQRKPRADANSQFGSCGPQTLRETTTVVRQGNVRDTRVPTIQAPLGFPVPDREYAHEVDPAMFISICSDSPEASLPNYEAETGRSAVASTSLDGVALGDRRMALGPIVAGGHSEEPEAPTLTEDWSG